MEGGRIIPIKMEQASKTGLLKYGNISDLKVYQRLRLLGAGGFGKVYLVRHETTRKKFAAKEQRWPEGDRNGPKLAREEAKILQKLDNTKVMPFNVYNSV